MENFLISITLNQILKLALIIGILVIAVSIFYYYVIFLPQKEQTRIEQQKQEQLIKEEKEKENRQLLEDCLSTADFSLKTSFIALCTDNEQISGGDNTSCSSGTIDDIISYMTASKFYSSLFKRPLEKRENDRAECYKLYPQK